MLWIRSGFNQCSGSRSHLFWGLPDPNPLVKGVDPDPYIIFLSSSKNSKKNLDSYCFVISLGLFIFEKWLNVPKSNK